VQWPVEEGGTVRGVPYLSARRVPRGAGCAACLGCRDRQGADSEGCRSAFRTDVDHDSEVMSISVPN
jgi:hypothetical protein